MDGWNGWLNQTGSQSGILNSEEKANRIVTHCCLSLLFPFAISFVRSPFLSQTSSLSICSLNYNSTRDAAAAPCVCGPAFVASHRKQNFPVFLVYDIIVSAWFPNYQKRKGFGRVILLVPPSK